MKSFIWLIKIFLFSFTAMIVTTNGEYIFYESATTFHAQQYFNSPEPKSEELLVNEGPFSISAFDIMEDDLLEYMRCLKSYISGESFNVIYFTANQEELTEQLENISSTVETFPFNQRLFDILSYVKNMFQTMIHCSELLVHYKGLAAPGNKLLYKVIEVNVRVFGLQDSFGMLNQEQPSTFLSLVYLIENLQFWNDRFKSLSGVPFGTRKVFKMYFYKAECALKKLEAQIPEEIRSILT